MLKAELIKPRIERQQQRLAAKRLPADYAWLSTANDLISLYKSHRGKTRGQLNDALRQYEADSLHYAIIRGLAAVLDQFTVFHQDPAVPPAILRETLFSQGYALGDLRQARLEETAVQYNVSVQDVEASLFADLAEEQLIREFNLPSPARLIQQYNLEVARGVLYWAKSMHLTVQDGYKDLFKFIKLFRLMHLVTPLEKGYTIELFGPISPFVASTIRYGLQFAKFLPALLLCQNWQMTAQVRPPGQSGWLTYQLDDTTELISHFKQSGEYDSQLEADFAAAFAQKYERTARIWQMNREDELILVGDSVMIPDFSFTHAKNGRRALLEIIGFWHPNYLRRKLEKVRQANRSDLILLVFESANVSAEPFRDESAGQVLTFKNKPVLKEVLQAIEQAAI